jgi:hypothetical protein
VRLSATSGMLSPDITLVVTKDRDQIAHLDVSRTEQNSYSLAALCILCENNKNRIKRLSYKQVTISEKINPNALFANLQLSKIVMSFFFFLFPTVTAQSV